MGMTEIRTALKVDFKKPASEQPGLHVRVTMYPIAHVTNLVHRTDGILTVSIALNTYLRHF